MRNIYKCINSKYFVKVIKNYVNSISEWNDYMDFATAKKEIEKLQLETLLSGKYDKNNAILTLHPGAGGTESQDWAEMLYRMYTRWANSNGYAVQELDYLDGDEAGLKSVTFLISGDFAYASLYCCM